MLGALYGERRLSATVYAPLKLRHECQRCLYR